MNPSRPLTEREQAVLRLLLEGMSNPEIAKALGLAEQSVREHMASLLWKYGLPKRRHTLVARLLRRGEPREYCPKCERRREWLREESAKRKQAPRQWKSVLAPRPLPPAAFTPPPQFAARWQEILELEARAAHLRESLQADIAWEWVKQARARGPARRAAREEPSGADEAREAALDEAAIAGAMALGAGI